MELFDVNIKRIVHTPNSYHSDADTTIVGVDGLLKMVAEISGLGYCRESSMWDLKDMNISTTFCWIGVSVKKNERTHSPTSIHAKGL